MSSQPPVLVVAEPTEVDRYPTGVHRRVAAHTTRETIGAIERDRPAVVVMDWDLDTIDRSAVCRAARNFPMMTLLASMSSPDQAPAAIKAGCHAILLEPFAPHLAATRIARLSRQAAMPRGQATEGSGRGTHRRWPEVMCPACSAGGATSFDFSARHKLWFACLACEHVWTDRPPS